MNEGELNICKQIQNIANLTLEQNRKLILEIGSGNQPSPIETAINLNSTVVAVDLSFGKELTKPQNKRGVYYFPLNVFARNLDHYLPKFDRVHAISPQPSITHLLFERGYEFTKKDGFVVFALPPLEKGALFSPDTILSTIQNMKLPQCNPQLTYLPLIRLKTLMGTTASDYFGVPKLNNPLIPTLIAKKK